MMGPLYIICALISTAAFVTSEEDADAKKFETYKNRVCLFNPPFRGDPDFGYRWQEVMDQDEVLELAFVNMAYGLSSDAIAFRHEELGWRKDVIDILALVTKATCTDDIVSEQFLNSAKGLFLHYMRKYDNFRGNDTDMDSEDVKNIKKEEWDEILESLKTCAAQVTPIPINTDCGEATSFIADDGSLHPITIEMEQFDIIAATSNVDTIMDAMWWMFSTTYARCYSYFYPNEDVILLFFQLFREAFFFEDAEFAARWSSVGPQADHFPIIFGPYESAISFNNVRKCATAAFDYEGLRGRMLVRPVTITVDNVQTKNFKVGAKPGIFLD
ncbi:hypothetical protein Ocin01_00019 [Orchesella cincta]|uniref:Uncharacterized protein n=1 Tax=Orchesella cincta TaxID=48709 RepID=A0A1D2NN77_ORCCI|nr:hypothetical protein Ocin01_00019 [Orchesella cincta]